MTTETLYKFGPTDGDKRQVSRSEMNEMVLELAREALDCNAAFSIENFATKKSVAGYDMLIVCGLRAYYAEVIPQYAVRRQRFLEYDAATLSDYTTSLQQATEDLEELIAPEIETMTALGGEIKIWAGPNTIKIRHEAETIEMYVADENDYNIDGDNVYGKIVDEVLRQYEGVVLRR